MALFLSVVETLCWEYVVIENVVGLLSCSGMLERILLALASLGYQVRATQCIACPALHDGLCCTV